MDVWRADAMLQCNARNPAVNVLIALHQLRYCTQRAPA